MPRSPPCGACGEPCDSPIRLGIDDETPTPIHFVCLRDVLDGMAEGKRWVVVRAYTPALKHGKQQYREAFT